MVSGGRRRGGPLHDEMTWERGGEELATPHAANDAKSGDKEKPGGRGRAGSRTDTAVDECRTKW